MSRSKSLAASRRRQLRQGMAVPCRCKSPVLFGILATTATTAGLSNVLQVAVSSASGRHLHTSVCPGPRQPCRPCRLSTLPIGLERQAGPAHPSRAAVTCALLCTQLSHPKRDTYPCPRPRPPSNQPPATPPAPMNIGRAAGVSPGGAYPPHHCTLSRLPRFPARPRPATSSTTTEPFSYV